MDLSRIDMSISHGKLNSKKMLVVWWFVLIASLFLPLFTILYVILYEIDDFFWSVLFVDILCFFMIALSLLFIIWNNRTKKKFILYLKDGIEVKATVKQEDSMSPPLAILPYIKMRIDFIINDNVYTKFSSYGKGKTKGYHPVFKKYVGREIDILYSQKYDEVLILKG